MADRYRRWSERRDRGQVRQCTAQVGLVAAREPGAEVDRLHRARPTTARYGATASAQQPPQPGQPATVLVKGLKRPVWGGSSVSNVRPGYPGPQPAFDYNDPKYKPVIPYLLRVK